MAKNKNLFNEENVIKMIFENDKKVYNLDENLLTSAAKYTGNKIKQAGKDIGKGLLNFAAFNFICRVIAEQLNKNWALKKVTGQVVGGIYQQSLIVLSFFYKSKYKLVILRGFSKYYSWDLALAVILIHEGFQNDKGVAFAIKEAYSTTPDKMKIKIEDAYNKIKNKTYVISPLSLDVVDKNATVDRSREVGGKFGKMDIEIDKIVSWYRSRIRIMSNPTDFKDDIERRFKSSRSPNAQTITFLDTISNALDDIDTYWTIGLTGTQKNEIIDSIYQGQSEVKFTRPAKIKDTASKEINIANVSGIVNINDGFVLENIDNPNKEKMKAKIIFCLLLIKLKTDAMALRALKDIISKIDLLSRP